MLFRGLFIAYISVLSKDYDENFTIKFVCNSVIKVSLVYYLRVSFFAKAKMR